MRPVRLDADRAGDRCVGKISSPGDARGDEHRERVRRRRLLLAEGDRGLVAMVAVGDQQRHVELDAPRRAAARPSCARRPPRRPSRGSPPAARRAGRRRRAGRSARAGSVSRAAPQAALLRAGVGELVRQHLAGPRTASPRSTPQTPRACARRRRGRRSPARSTRAPAPPPQDAPLAPVGKRARRPPPRSRAASGGRCCTGSRRGRPPRGLVDHVVGRSDQLVERAGDALVVAERPKRGDRGTRRGGYR